LGNKIVIRNESMSYTRCQCKLHNIASCLEPWEAVLSRILFITCHFLLYRNRYSGQCES